MNHRTGGVRLALALCVGAGSLATGVLAVGCSSDKGSGDDSTTPGTDDSSTPGKDDSTTMPVDDSSSSDDSGTLPKSDATLVINEILAINQTTNVDENKQHEDWIEIFNTGAKTVSLGGFQLTDKLGDSTHTPWAIPAGNDLAAGGYFLVWCDNDAQDGPLHADFKLDGTDGEGVALLDAAGALVDATTYGTQVADMSWARHPDGGDTWQASTPTPLAANP